MPAPGTWAGLNSQMPDRDPLPPTKSLDNQPAGTKAKGLPIRFPGGRDLTSTSVLLPLTGSSRQDKTRDSRPAMGSEPRRICRINPGEQNRHPSYLFLAYYRLKLKSPPMRHDRRFYVMNRDESRTPPVASATKIKWRAVYGTRVTFSRSIIAP